MITEAQFQEAVSQRTQAHKVIEQYFKEYAQRLQARIDSKEPFTDEELVYSATSRCPCGHGLAYPKNCNPDHYWDCAAILKGIAVNTVKHTGRLPFMFYEVKSEGQRRGTTREQPVAAEPAAPHA